MRFVDEYRDPARVRALLDAIQRAATRTWTIMEVCGGQTHAIVRGGLDELLRERVELVHGPGCPVCVTPIELIDQAQAIAARPGAILTSFGDMLRVPGSQGDLLACRARGGDVRIVYSPLDALRLAREQPDREVVFFAVGFETTAPATALALQQARRVGARNFSVLCAHVRVPPAMELILGSPQNRIQAFLGPGHVCTVMGTEEYLPVAARYRVPIVITGFEPVDLLDGILRAVTQLEAGRHSVENQYSRLVAAGGNGPALALLREVFRPVERAWRGIGPIPASGLGIAPAYQDHDAGLRFGVAGHTAREHPECIAGRVLSGQARPSECPAFGSRCTPERPLGAPMVSAEGACAAYHAYGRGQALPTVGV